MTMSSWGVSWVYTDGTISTLFSLYIPFFSPPIPFSISVFSATSPHGTSVITFFFQNRLQDCRRPPLLACAIWRRRKTNITYRIYVSPDWRRGRARWELYQWGKSKLLRLSSPSYVRESQSVSISTIPATRFVLPEIFNFLFASFFNSIHITLAINNFHASYS